MQLARSNGRAVAVKTTRWGAWLVVGERVSASRCCETAGSRDAVLRVFCEAWQPIETGQASYHCRRRGKTQPSGYSRSS